MTTITLRLDADLKKDLQIYKLKIRIKNKSFRLVIFSANWYLKIILINIFDKKDKKLWENISWNLCKDEIIKFYNKNLDDIKNNNYKVIKI